MNKSKALSWVLRLAVFGTFLGHGVFALQGEEGWFKYFYSLGIMQEETIISILLVVGILDIFLAIMVLVKPIKPLLLWMAFWAFWTALLRWPIGGEPIWEFFESSANWGAPLALLISMGWPRTLKEWFR